MTQKILIGRKKVQRFFTMSLILLCQAMSYPICPASSNLRYLDAGHVTAGTSRAFQILGEGIRTPDSVARIPAFQAGALNQTLPPLQSNYITSCHGDLSLAHFG